MKWLSDIAPLILLEARLAPFWGGAEWASVEAIANDYERACAVQGYIGKIAVGDGWGLVLGDEPCATMWIRHNDRREGLLARWMWADDKADVERRLADLPADDGYSSIDSVDFEFRDSILVLFNSATPGDVGIEMGLSITV